MVCILWHFLSWSTPAILPIFKKLITILKKSFRKNIEKSRNSWPDLHPKFQTVCKLSIQHVWCLSMYPFLIFFNKVSIEKCTFSLTGKCSKISNTFLFLSSNKMWVIRTGILKLLVRIANREDPDQTASLEAVWFVSALFAYSSLAGII